jgi:hypothetical protein
MKATFTAFGGKLRSTPMELPDNTTDRFYLPLDMDVFSLSPKMDGTMIPEPPVMKRGTFQWTGNYLSYADGTNARDYVLIDIS